jgi:hypothetical protein
MRPIPSSETLRKFLTEQEIAEATARAADVAHMSRLDLIRFGLASVAHAAGERLAERIARLRTHAAPSWG